MSILNPCSDCGAGRTQPCDCGAPTVRDLTNAPGTFTHEQAMSIRDCANCHHGIHIGRERISHRPLASSSVTDFYHPECVVIP